MLKTPAARIPTAFPSRRKAVLLAATLLLAFCQSAGSQPAPIALDLVQHLAPSQSERWVDNGIPLPEGGVSDASNLSLWRGGVSVDADFHPLAFWADGSLRWVKTAFRASAATGYEVRPGTGNATSPELFSATKVGDTWTVSTGAIRFTMREAQFNLFDELWISSAGDGIYDRDFILTGASDGPGDLVGTITRIEDGPMSKRFLFKETYSGPDVGIYAWITAYRGSGKVTVEYTIRNGKSALAQAEDGTLHLNVVPGSGVSTRIYGSAVSSGTSIASIDLLPSLRGAAQLGGSNGAVSVLINRFSEMFPRSIELDASGDVDLTLTTGSIRPMTAHGVDLHFDFHPEVWSDVEFQAWADYYEFPDFALPSHSFIQESRAWDGYFVGDAGSMVPNISDWEADYAFAPNSPGYLQYGENLIQTAGNGHGLSDQFATAFNRFLVLQDPDRFLQAEELAIVCMESRGIIMDDVEILLDGSGYDAVDALFGTTDWTDPVEGRMWDANHRGHYPITEYYYLTGKMRAADAWNNLNKSSKFIFLDDVNTRYDMRPSGYYLSHFARSYSITREQADLDFLDFYWTFLHTPGHSVGGNPSWDPMHLNGFFVSWSEFQSDCGFSGDEVKLIFASNWIQAAYDAFYLGGYEQAMDHIYAAGRWLMQIYGELSAGQSPEYCYRAWAQTTPPPAAPQGYWNAQDFPGIAIFYEHFGDLAIRDTLARIDEVCFDCGGRGFAAPTAAALEREKADHLAPPAISELFIDFEPSGGIRLNWQNVADASRLQIKFTDAAGEIKDLHTLLDQGGVAYWQMDHVADEPDPLPEGQWQSTVLDLPGGPEDYRFVMKSWDEHGNISALSAVGSAEGSIFSDGFESGDTSDWMP